MASQTPYKTGQSSNEETRQRTLTDDSSTPRTNSFFRRLLTKKESEVEDTILTNDSKMSFLSTLMSRLGFAINEEASATKSAIKKQLTTGKLTQSQAELAAGHLKTSAWPVSPPTSPSEFKKLGIPQSYTAEARQKSREDELWKEELEELMRRDKMLRYASQSLYGLRMWWGDQSREFQRKKASLQEVRRNLETLEVTRQKLEDTIIRGNIPQLRPSLASINYQWDIETVKRDELIKWFGVNYQVMGEVSRQYKQIRDNEALTPKPQKEMQWTTLEEVLAVPDITESHFYTPGQMKIWLNVAKEYFSYNPSKTLPRRITAAYQQIECDQGQQAILHKEKTDLTDQLEASIEFSQGYLNALKGDEVDNYDVHSVEYTSLQTITREYKDLQKRLKASIKYIEKRQIRHLYHY